MEGYTLIIMLLTTVAVLMLAIKYQNAEYNQAIATPSGLSSCESDFNIDYYGKPPAALTAANVVLIGEDHGQTEGSVAHCLMQLAKSKDTLLLEVKQAGPVACDAVNTQLKPLNGKMQCLSWDTQPTPAYHTYGDAATKVNVLITIYHKLIEADKSLKQNLGIIRNYLKFLKSQEINAITAKSIQEKTLVNTAHAAHSLTQTKQLMQNYLGELLKNGKGYHSLDDFKAYLWSEYQYYYKLGMTKEHAARHIEPNQKMTRQIKDWLSTPQTNRLFVIAGKNHLSAKHNPDLFKLLSQLDEDKVVARLMPKT